VALSESNRRSGIKKAQKLLPDTRVRGYAVGRTGVNPVVAVSVVLGGAAAFNLFLFALTGAFIFPGVLAALVIQHFISPPCGVVVADQGVALMKRSLWNGRPSEVTAVMAHGYVHPVEEALGRVKMTVGHEDVWMTKGEERLLREAANLAATTAAAPGGPASALPYGASVPDAGTNEIFAEGLGWFARSFVVGLLYTIGGVFLLISVSMLAAAEVSDGLGGLALSAVPLAMAEGLRRLTRSKPAATPAY
jgi:hypothetical protein